MRNTKQFQVMTLLLALLAGGYEAVQADEELASEAAVSATETNEAQEGGAESATGQADAVELEKNQGIVIPSPAAQASQEPIRARSMQDDAEQALARGGNQSDTSDRTLPLLAFLGLGAFVFFSRKRGTGTASSVAEPVVEEAEASSGNAEVTETAEDVAAPTAGLVEATAPVSETSEAEASEELAVEEMAADETEAEADDESANETTESGESTQSTTSRSEARSSLPRKTRPGKRGKGR